MTDEKSPKTDKEPDVPEESEAVEAEAIPEGTEPEKKDNAEESKDELSEILKKLEETEARAEAMHERSLRALAELDNYRKRMARDRQELMKTAAADVIESLLPALDNLRIGLQSAPNQENLKDVTKGFEMVGQQIISALEEHGLKTVDPENQPFDPHFHDSLSTQPSEEVEEGNVVQTLKVGYLLNDKLLRPASVVVSSGPAEESPDDEAVEEKAEGKS